MRQSIQVLPLSPRVSQRIKKYSLSKKFAKQVHLLTSNLYHPNLHVELLEPKDHGIYSFRIDRKFRALFIFRKDKKVVEILTVTMHYE